MKGLITMLKNLIYEGMPIKELKEKSELDNRAFFAQFNMLVKNGFCYKENDIIHLGFRPIKVLNEKDVIAFISRNYPI
jgi:hypothetical protein